mgnify:CR=1 FL=1
MDIKIESRKADGTVVKRLGKVLISHSLLFGDYGITNKVLSQMVVIDTKKRPDNIFEYTGISPLFDIVEGDAPIPTYLVQFSYENKEIKFIKGV